MAAVIGSLRAELSASIAKFQDDMGRAADSVKSVSKEFTKVANDFKRTGSQLQSIGTSLTKTITLPLVALGGSIAKVGIDFESSFAGVRKTVSATEAEFTQMALAFRKLSKEIPINVNEINRLGESAGALGIPKAQIVDFVRVMAELGATTNLTSDQAAESIAKIQTVFKSAGQETDRFGAALVHLGKNGASSEVEILALAQRLASAGVAIGLSQAQVLGFAAAMANVGIEAEAGGSALSKVFGEISVSVSKGGTAVKAFADVAGLSAAQFSALFKTDAAAAIQAFIQGLGRMKDEGGDLNLILDTLGFSEIRQARTLRDLALSGNNLSDAMKNAGQGWRENSALSAAAGERFKTTAAQLTLLWTRIKDVGITLFDSLKPAIVAALSVFNSLLPIVERLAQAFGNLPGGVQLSVIGFLAFVAALGPVIFLAGQLISSLGVVLGAFGKAGLATRALTTTFGFVHKALGALTSAMVIDGAVVVEWGTTIVSLGSWLARLGGILGTVGAAIAGLVNPVTLTIAAIGALALGVTAVTGHWGGLVSVLKSVWQVAKDTATIVGFVLVGALKDLAQWTVSVVAAVWKASDPFAGFLRSMIDLAKVIAGPVIAAFQIFVAWVKEHIPTWVTKLLDGIEHFAEATKKHVREAADSWHEYAEGVRAAKAAQDAIPQLASPAGTDKQLLDARGLGDVGQMLAVLNTELKSVATDALRAGGSFSVLQEGLKAARAELAGLTSQQLRDLAAAFKSGAYSIDDLKKSTGLGEAALKLFQDQVQATGKATTKAAKEISDMAEAQQGLADLFAPFEAIGGYAADAVTLLLEMGASVEMIAKAFPYLGKAAVKAFADATERGKALAESQASISQAMLADSKALTDQMLDDITAGLARARVTETEYLERRAAFHRTKADEIRLAWNKALKDLGAPPVGFVERAAWQKAADAINRAFVDELADEDMQQALKKAGEKDANSFAVGFSDILQDIPNLLREAFTGGGGFGGAAKALGSSITNLFARTVLTPTKFGQWASDGIASVMTSFGAEALAASTAAIGIVSFGIGAAITLGVGLIQKLFAEDTIPEWQLLGREIGRRFGVGISEGLAKSLEHDSFALRDRIKIPALAPTANTRNKAARELTGLVHLSEIITDTGGVLSFGFQKAVSGAHDLFSEITKGTLSVQEAGRSFDAIFGQLSEQIKPGSVVSKGFRELIDLNKEFGTSAKSVGVFVADQVKTNIVGGLKAFTESAVKVSSQGAADALAATLGVAFEELQKAGVPILEIVDQLEPLIAKLGQQFADAGFQGGAAFASLTALAATAKDEIAGPAIQSIVGLGSALAGLNNIGALDQATFAGLTEQITATFSGLVAQGKDGGQILRLLQQPLQAVWQLAKDFGFAVDEGTQALLDQAEGAGIVGEKQRPIQEQMLEATNRIAEAAEAIATAFGFIPRAAKNAADGINDAFAGLKPVTIPISFSDPGFGNVLATPETGPIQMPAFKYGSDGLQDFGTGTVAMLHGREAVITEAELSAMNSAGRRSAGAVKLHVSATIQAWDGADVARTVRSGAFVDALSEAIARGKRGLGEALGVPV